jgi:hypothetical protein
MSEKIIRISFPLNLEDRQWNLLDEGDEVTAKAIEVMLRLKLNAVSIPCETLHLDGVWDSWDDAGWGDIDLMR